MNKTAFLSIGLLIVWAGTGGQSVPKGNQQIPVEKWTHETHDKTNFPLVGRHRTVQCAECHLKGVFEGTPTACESCHWDRRRDDRYGLRLGNHCGDCHTPFSWKEVSPDKWDHLTVTGFRLEGEHRGLDCYDCHGSELKKSTADCFRCHAEDFAEAGEPNHQAAKFPTDCTLCHRGRQSWEGAIFSHSGFVLRGRHKTASCSECHKDSRYQGLPSDCTSCHLDDYRSAKEPDHQKLGFPVDCVLCHEDKAEQWGGAKFDHQQFWALQGPHANMSCLECHSKGFDLPKDCYGCHQADYNATSSPNHKSAGFGTTCQDCHLASHVSWNQASVDHAKFWPLQGAHKTAACAACHSRGYDLPRECYGCHQADYNAAANPNHKTSGFPTACETCHYPSHTFWSQAVFAHGFPIKAGKHAGFNCLDCHTTGNVRDFSCIDCHAHEKADMDSEHRGIPGYSFASRSCYTCHPKGIADD